MRGYNAYQQNSVNHASKEQLLLMLLDGSVKFAKRGRLAIEENKVKDAHENLIKTQNIYIELLATLQVDPSEEWGQKLKSVYQYIITKLSEANMKKDVAILDDIIPLIEDVRDTWNDVYKASKQQQAGV